MNETPAKPQFTRAFVRDKKNLQREQKPGVPGFLTTAAYLVVLAIAVGLLSSLAWGLSRFARRSQLGDRIATGAGAR